MIAIPNMDKPKNCRECRLRSYEWSNEYVSSHHICHALRKAFNGRGFDGGRYIDIDKEVHPDCPLIDIDDELFKQAESAYVLQQIRNR